MADAEDLFKAARAAYRLAMVGRTAFAVATWARMTAPRPGDLVIELSTMSRSFDPDRIAVLVEDYGGGAYLVRSYEDDRDMRWANAEFVAVPGRGEGWPS